MSLTLPQISAGLPGTHRVTRIALLTAVAIASACAPRGDGAGDATPGAGTPPLGSLNSSNPAYALPRSCELEDMRSWVYDNMKDYYLFYDQVDPNVALQEFDDLDTLVRQLRVQPFDSFSNISDEAGYTARFTEGETFDFGWRLQRNQQNEFFLKLVEKYSPLANAGIERGDQLLSINGIPMAEFIQQTSAQISAVLGIEDERVTIDLSIRKSAGDTVDVSVIKSTYPLDTVLDTQVIDHNGTQVGYLHFYQFIDTSAAELLTAFTKLEAANVSELVLDLRYNSGGRVVIANELASYIAGNGKTDKPFATYRPNDKFADNAISINFVNQAQALDLNRVFILQSAETCSASELVVNGLRPFMDVITVGATTCGKPYASNARAACGKVMSALELESTNADGAGGYYDGINADCLVSENVSLPLGSPSEPLFKAALDYASIGTCNSLAARTRAPAELPLPVQLRPPELHGSIF